MEAGRDALSFELTPGQDHALGAILAGLQGPPPMMCLLQARARPLCPARAPPCLLRQQWPVEGLLCCRFTAACVRLEPDRQYVAVHFWGVTVLF